MRQAVVWDVQPTTSGTGFVHVIFSNRATQVSGSPVRETAACLSSLRRCLMTMLVLENGLRRIMLCKSDLRSVGSLKSERGLEATFQDGYSAALFFVQL